MKGFPDLINVDFTSHMELELDEIEEGNDDNLTGTTGWAEEWAKWLETSAGKIRARVKVARMDVQPISTKEKDSGKTDDKG